jgi:dTMP kinase
MVYFAFIGINGSGKSSIIKLIKESGKIDAVYTTEPIGRDLKNEYRDMYPEYATYMFAADRFIHMKQVIRPAFEEGKTIISDRCYICNLAYQGNDGVSQEWIEKIQPENLIKPDVVIFLHCDSEIAAKRRGISDPSQGFKIQQNYTKLMINMCKKTEVFMFDTTSKESKQKIANDIIDIIKERTCF